MGEAPLLRHSKCSPMDFTTYPRAHTGICSPFSSFRGYIIALFSLVTLSSLIVSSLSCYIIGQDKIMSSFFGHKLSALCLTIFGYKSRADRGICQSSQGSWRVNIIINFMSCFRNVLQPGLCFTSHLPLYLLLVRQHFNFIDVTLVYEDAK